MRKALEYLVYSNIWISCGAFCFGGLFYVLNDLDFNLYLLSFLFCSTLLTYTYQRFEKLRSGARTSGPRMVWMKTNSKLVMAILVLSTIGSLFFAYFLSIQVLIILVFLGLMSFFYAFKLKIGKGRSNLRDIPFIKIVLIGSVWAGSCYVLPFIESGSKDLSLLVPSLAFFFFIIGITIPFDIRDLDVDERSKKTIPQMAGETLSKMIGASLLLISAIIILSNFPGKEIALCLTYAISILAIMSTKKVRNELFFSFGIDGLLILVPLGFYLLNSL
ncbi:MAG: hypothetical protein ACI857_000865 [Arenicella sp.]|jgi:hypothetical protein